MPMNIQRLKNYTAMALASLGVVTAAGPVSLVAGNIADNNDASRELITDMKANDFPRGTYPEAESQVSTPVSYTGYSETKDFGNHGMDVRALLNVVEHADGAAKAQKWAAIALEDSKVNIASDRPVVNALTQSLDGQGAGPATTQVAANPNARVRYADTLALENLAEVEDGGVHVVDPAAKEALVQSAHQDPNPAVRFAAHLAVADVNKWQAAHPAQKDANWDVVYGKTAINNLKDLAAHDDVQPDVQKAAKYQINAIQHMNDKPKVVTNYAPVHASIRFGL